MNTAVKAKTQRLALGSRQHDKVLDKVLMFFDYAAEGKRTVEKEALIADRHYCSWIDEQRHPWPTKTYDPLFFSTRQSRIAATMDAVFSNPPLHDYRHQGRSTFEQARIMTRLSDYHELQTKLLGVGARGQLEDFVTGLGNAGTAFAHIYWDYRERHCGYWQRSPMQVEYLDPLTGQLTHYWSDEGEDEYIRGNKVVLDSPRFKNLPIWSVFPDDTCSNIQDGDFILFRDMISKEDARQRVKTNDWDKEAVEAAIRADGFRDGRGRTARNQIFDQLSWMEKLGLRTDHYRESYREVGGEYNAVELIECWWRKGPKIMRTVVLNRVAIALHGESPFGHGMYPFVMGRNYRLPGQFWGISDYHIVRFLLRGYQTLRNAGITEAMLAAMPPLLVQAGIRIIGKRYAPMSEWRVEGDPNMIRFFERSGRAQQMSTGMAEGLASQMTRGIGTSEVSMGSAAGTKGIAATNVNLAYESAGRKDKLFIDNLSDSCLVPWANQKRELIQQFQEYEVQLQMDPGSDPVTVYPQQWRDADLYAIPTASTSVVKALQQKRAQDLYDLVKKYQEPYADHRAAFEMFVEAVSPADKEDLVKSEEQVQQEQMQQMMMQQQAQQQQPQLPAGPGGPPIGPGGGATDAIASEMREAMAVA